MDRQKILESKILIPDIQKDYEQRNTLLSELEAESVRLLVLHATIGYGKTVLMSQYARLPGVIPAWYHLDSLDNELATFFQYLVMSLDRALGGFEFEETVHFEIASASTDQLVRDLVMALGGVKLMEGQKLVLMLDDFQVLDNSEIFRLLEELLDHTDDRFLLMATTKGSVPDSFTKYFMRNQGTMIGFERLSFRETEVHNILSRMLSGEEAEQYTKMIWEHMEGWPAGVMFSILYLRRLGSRALDVKWEHISQESWVQNYVAYELFKGLPFDIQQFLLRTSFAEELQPELCNDICGINNANGILKYLLQENMFILRVGGRSGSYRYHSMFRSFLNDRASEEQKKDACGKIALFYLKHQEMDVAAKYAIMAGEPRILMMILEKYGLPVLWEEKRKQVTEYLKYIGESDVEMTPAVCLIAAVHAFWDGSYARADEMISAACEQDPAYVGYKNLFCGLSLLKSPSKGQGFFEMGKEGGQGCADKSDEGISLVLNGCKLLKQKKWDIPPLPEDMREILYRIEKKQLQGGEQQKLLHISCFGKFRVMISKTGKEIAWRTRKALELFAYLVDLEGRPVERRALLEQLWPDNAPNNTVAMLHNMIYSIRKELSSQPELADLIQYKGHQYYLDISKAAIDLDSKKQICRLAETGNAKELYKRREEVLHNWGVYLEEVDGTWCMARRTYFERTYGKACRLLAGYCREQGDYETETSCWTAYMAADRYSEEAVVGLLRCYANMGERQQMKRIYESARKIFQEEIGLELSPETIQVYQQAMGSKRVVRSEG